MLKPDKSTFNILVLPISKFWFVEANTNEIILN